MEAHSGSKFGKPRTFIGRVQLLGVVVVASALEIGVSAGPRTLDNSGSQAGNPKSIAKAMRLVTGNRAQIDSVVGGVPPRLAIALEVVAGSQSLGPDSLSSPVGLTHAGDGT